MFAFSWQLHFDGVATEQPECNCIRMREFPRTPFIVESIPTIQSAPSSLRHLRLGARAVRLCFLSSSCREAMGTMPLTSADGDLQRYRIRVHRHGEKTQITQEQSSFSSLILALFSYTPIPSSRESQLGLVDRPMVRCSELAGSLTRWLHS